ncbi:hypothetical protein HT136_11810 [Novosphingobium profundi]|uniref:hypothetical protein n=1 Tax=Novosphingobium profundi TaxID=1774954 RepID=UPI001BDAAE69|nr:hypothetical protein [Novosphingobium profundi]MBT0669049.1 hypothetical protein [Novosphingobium profundi]
MFRRFHLLPVLALAACGNPPPKAQVVTTDGKAIAEICGVPETMFSGGKGEATVTLVSTLTDEQRTCTLREVRRSLPAARIVEAGSRSTSAPSAPNPN